MLVFIGLGLEQSPTLDALELLKKCDQIFYESYTSPVLDQDFLSQLRALIRGSEQRQQEIVSVKREFVEDGRRILDLAKAHLIALVSSGDPMTATTHQELRVRAIEQGIETRIMHGSSILQAVGGEFGLSSYSFGKTVTITRGPMQQTPYLTIYQNILRGLHTTILLEFDETNNFFLDPKDAVSALDEAEKDLRYGIIEQDTLILAISGIGRKGIIPKLVCTNPSTARIQEYGSPPTTLVIPGKLHFTELEALSAIFHRPKEQFKDNSQNIERLSKRMLSKYSEKTRLALKRARASAEKTDHLQKYENVFENVELYTNDAMRFLNEGKEELAILSIGYAEGLLDSLRFSGELDFDW